MESEYKKDFRKPLSAFAARQARKARDDRKSSSETAENSPQPSQPSDKRDIPKNAPPASYRRKPKAKSNGYKKNRHNRTTFKDRHDSNGPDPIADISPALNFLIEGNPNIDDFKDKAFIDSEASDRITISSRSDASLEPDELTPASRLSILKDGVISKSSGRLSVHIALKDEDEITLIGLYNVRVLKGAVRVLGAIIRPNEKSYTIFCPSTHALPSICHLRSPFKHTEQAEIIISSFKPRLRLLRRLHPDFEKIWNYENTNDAVDRSFSILLNSEDDPKKRSLVKIDPTPIWQKLLVSLTNPEDHPDPAIFICGPKGAGKSTFGRLLTNTLLSSRASVTGIAFLDLDPGQPEYSAPGDISLFHVHAYNLGPPFTHPGIPSSSPNKVVRSHHIGNLSPREDIVYYLQCAFDLLNRYSRDLRPLNCPLIVNTCGWILGSGLEILETLIRGFPMTNTIYMSIMGPVEVVESLRSVTAKRNGTFHLLPSQVSPSGSRSASQLRSMQTMSYFHLDKPVVESLRWDPAPLYMRRPYKLQYAGENPDIVGIMILGNEVSPNVMKTIINGSVLALVAIEDESALPASVVNNRYGGGLSINDTESTSDNIPALRYSSTEGLPYLFTGHGANTPLDPTKTRSLGQVLVRGIDTVHRHLSILTPIPPKIIASHRAASTMFVLVRGQLDTPNWSYTEEYYEATAAQRDRRRWRRFREEYGIPKESDEESEVDGEDPLAFDVEAWLTRTPWVEAVKQATEEDEKKRAGTEKVWKIRRNLVTNEAARKNRNAGGI